MQCRDTRGMTSVMRIVPTLALLLTLLQAHAASELIYVGTRGKGQDAATDVGQGIYAARLDTTTGKLEPLGLQKPHARATTLLTHPTLPVLYAALDVDGNRASGSNVHSFAIDPVSGRLSEINNVSSGGLDATQFKLDSTSRTLLVANHDSGDITTLPVKADGSLGAVVSIQKHYGTGPHPRQSRPQAHGVAVDPSGHFVVASDFGADRLFFYRFDRQTRAMEPARPPFESLPPGSGPRHLVFPPHSKFLYLLTEFSAELRSYRWDTQAGRVQLVATLPSYAGDDSGQPKSAADLVASSDGRFLYISLRGDQNSIVVYATSKSSGKVTEVQRLPSGGKTPWSIGIDRTGQWLLATNEGSNSVTMFGIDRKTGKLSATDQSLSVPRPVAVALY